ncbi:MAG: M20/M25/M40 family metallo-hydrolase [Thermotogae bacterium]|nr:M20/M25/M40 family metallo-hydrolase [Thermotogota bacterium]
MVSSNPVNILVDLIRFNTTNPPGNERECVYHVKDILEKSGIETQIFYLDERRPNLLAKIEGTGESPPILLYGHVDVVTTEGQRWEHPPFEGKIVDGFIWGRGALDMKGGVAMMISAVLRIKEEKFKPSGDILLLILSDEEGGGDFGARYMVENHPDLFKDVKYAIGEFGGFTLHIGGRRFYPIMVSEKRICWLRLKTRGRRGHGSIPMKNGAMAKMGKVLVKLNHRDTPIHVTKVVKDMFSGISREVGFPMNIFFRLLINPAFTDIILKLLGEKSIIFEPLLRNTVNPTIIKGGDKVNVIPGEITLDLDGRLLPGYSPEDLMEELRRILGGISDEVEMEIVRYDEGPSEPDMGLFTLLGEILRDLDEQAIPIPMLLSGATDARFFSKLGIQTYGFIPMNLPEDFKFMELIHSTNERIPISALEFGANAIYELLKRYKI